MNKNETEYIFVFIPKEIWEIFLIYVFYKELWLYSFVRGEVQILKSKNKKQNYNVLSDSPIVVITVPEKNKDPVKVHFSSHPLVYPQLSASAMIATNSFITSWLMLYLINMWSMACFALCIPSCSLFDSSCLKTNIPMAR